MDGYMKIYVKKDRIGHVRYEIGNDYGFKEIRGLSVGGDFPNLYTIYERGEEDSHYISVYNTDEYLASEKIPLEREELVSALAYTKTNDQEHEEYGMLSQNCNDFTAGVLSAAGKPGCVGDYLSPEQKDDLRLSQGSDLIKCKIPKKIDDWNDEFKDGAKKVKNKVKEVVCNGIVKVNSYIRQGSDVEGYTRSCGRH